MLTEGLGLMAAGMGMVFSFLILLVLIMMASSKFLNRFFSPLEDLPSDCISSNNEPGRSKEDLAEIAVAIALAESRHDKRE